MTVYISPNPGKAMAYGISQRAAQILLTHGAQVLMQDGLQAECMTMGVVYLSQKECLERTDVILTIGGDGTILHEANLSLEYRKPILGINLGRCGFLATCEVDEMEAKLSAVARGEYFLDNRMLLYVRVLGDDSWEGHACSRQWISASIVTISWWNITGAMVSLWQRPPAPPLILWRQAGRFLILRPRASLSHPSAPTALPARPWFLRRSARSTSVWARWQMKKFLSAVMGMRAIP